MELLLYPLARLILGVIQSLPLRIVARLGRFGGLVAYALDSRHRRVALRNLEMCFGGEKSHAEIKAIARENFRRIGENFACAAKTAAMDFSEIQAHVEFITPPGISTARPGEATDRFVGAIGHFGNFELYARFGQYIRGVKCASTYRALRQPSLNRLMLSMREKSGTFLFERRTEAEALKAAMQTPGILLGLLLDQHAGTGGVIVPFFGKDCSTSASAAVFALRYDCPLHTGICYRVGLAQWRIEPGPEIPTRINGEARPVADITRDINRAFEAAVRRDPANWFWVHNRWKTPKKPVHRTPAMLPTESPAPAEPNRS